MSQTIKGKSLDQINRLENGLAVLTDIVEDEENPNWASARALISVLMTHMDRWMQAQIGAEDGQ